METTEIIPKPAPKELSLEQASQYTGIEDYWLEELLLIGDLESLHIKDLDKYLSDSETEEIQKPENKEDI